MSKLRMETVGVRFWKKQRAAQDQRLFPSEDVLKSWPGRIVSDLCEDTAAPERAHERACASERGSVFNRQE